MARSRSKAKAAAGRRNARPGGVPQRAKVKKNAGSRAAAIADEPETEAPPAAPGERRPRAESSESNGGGGAADGNDGSGSGASSGEGSDSETSTSSVEEKERAPKTSPALMKASGPDKKEEESSEDEGSSSGSETASNFEEESGSDDEAEKAPPPTSKGPRNAGTAGAPQKTKIAKKVNAKNVAEDKDSTKAPGKKSRPKEEPSESDDEQEAAGQNNESESSTSSGEEESDGESSGESETSSVDKDERVSKKESPSLSPAPFRKKTPDSDGKEESSEEEGSSSGSGNDSEGESGSNDEEKATPPASKRPNSSDKKVEESVRKSKAPPNKKKKAEDVSPGEDTSSSGSSSSDDDGDDSSTSGSGEEDGAGGFTDQNADWLKPKKRLMSSDDEGDDDSSDDDEGMLEVERQSRLIDDELRLEKEEAEAELQRTIAQQTSVFHLPTSQELEDDAERVVPPSELRARIDDVLEVLADFRPRREPGRSRSEYIERLSSDMAELFGYLQELVDYFLSMFGPTECLAFLEASEQTRPLVVRVNTLRARRKDLAAALMKRGVRLDPLASWSKVGLVIHESNVPIGATPEYLAGHYMLQSAASMCPVMALAPQQGDRVLDMSAAPGGKTSYIAQLMRNAGVVVANDLRPERQKATVANLHRLGVRNAITCSNDGRKLGKLMRGSFDRVLLDAPCSGLGVISRDPSVKVQRTIPDVKRCAHLQKELLLAAVDALNHRSKGGGCMVYSTCSVAVAENEEVVNYLLSRRDVKIVDTGLVFGKPGFTRFEQKRFHPSVALTRRFYPHVHNMDGFFVAKIQKLSDKQRVGEGAKDAEKAAGEEEDAEKAEATGGDNEKKELTGDPREDGRRSKKKQRGKRRGKASKGRGGGSDDDGPDVPRKRSKISQNPNVEQAQKKRRMNAKVTKPRRMKVAGM